MQTPVKVVNRPGLTAIAYRVGTHAQFKQTLLARLSDSRQPALARLTTRDDDDFTIALLDAWATVADVLTFYQERIANEAYLQTATERLSVLELARLIGYELRPGVAASTYIAFTLEEAPGAFGQGLSLDPTAENKPEPPPPITIDVGAKVQSVPGPGQQAQIYETVEKIQARVEWNVIKPRLTERHPIRRDADRLFFDGLATGLKPGDGLLLFPDQGGEPVFRQVEEVTLEEKKNRTRVQLQPLSTPPAASTVIGNPMGVPTFSGATRASTIALASSGATSLSMAAGAAASAAFVTSTFLNQTINSADFYVQAQLGRFEIHDVFANLTAIRQPPPSVFALRTRAAIFGHNAPSWDSLPNIQRFGEFVSKQDPNNPANTIWEFEPGPYSNRQNSWAEERLASYFGEPSGSTNVYLDNVYSTIVKDSFVVFKDGVNSRAYQVTGAAELSKSDFTLNAKISRLTLNTHNGFGDFTIRGTSVFGQSEELALARLPIEKVVSGEEIELDTWVDGLSAGQNIIVCGELDNERGVTACELATIKQVEHELGTEGFTRITLSTALDNTYVRDSVTIHANVALATHGETVQEVLGSGDASQSFQRFVLRQPPLTHVSASTPSGTETTLEVRVNDLLWREVSTFFGHGPDERIYVARLNDDGQTTVMFGDGKTGARLPTGQENVRATYRKGIGLSGLVKADQISQLMTRPLGLKSATNPIAPSGAADAESLDEARRNAPLTVLTLDRIVSLQDYEDFARAFAGIDKALATRTWTGQRQGVFVTLAGSNGAEVKSDSTLYKNLLAAIQQAGDPTVPLTVETYRQRFFRLAGIVQVHPDYLPEKVLAAVEQKMRDGFSFKVREFGQPVNLSEVIAVIQNVPGVKAVDVNEFYRSDQPPDRKSRLEAELPRSGRDAALPAKLLTLDPRPLDLEVPS